MSRYITWEDLVDRYPVIAKGTNAEEVSSAYIFYAEYELDAALSSYYTVPFSSNNITAKDLSIDLAYARAANFKHKEMIDFLKPIQDKIKMLKQGSMDMILDDGTSQVTVGETIWSSTEDYHPIFDHGDTLDMVVDSSQLTDEEDAKL